MLVMLLKCFLCFFNAFFVFFHAFCALVLCRFFLVLFFRFLGVANEWGNDGEDSSRLLHTPPACCVSLCPAFSDVVGRVLLTLRFVDAAVAAVCVGV